MTIWLLPVFVYLAGLWSIQHTAACLAKGELFAPTVGRGIAGVPAVPGFSLNIEGIVLLLVAATLILLGQVMRQASRQDAELKEFF
jgi:hypothetical protein